MLNRVGFYPCCVMRASAVPCGLTASSLVGECYQQPEIERRLWEKCAKSDFAGSPARASEYLFAFVATGDGDETPVIRLDRWGFCRHAAIGIAVSVGRRGSDRRKP